MSKNLKIAISGSQHSGKTTLLNSLRAHPKFKDFQFFDSVSRIVKNEGGNVNRNADKGSQLAIFEAHKKNLSTEGNCIFDRCMLDAVAYCTDAYRHNKISNRVYSYGRYCLSESINSQGPVYDYIFYLEPIPNMTEDGVRDTDENYRSEIVKIYEELVEECNGIILSGDVQERIDKLIEVVYG